MLYFAVTLYFVFLIYALKFDGKNASKLLIIICFFQNFVLMLLSSGIDRFLFSLLVLSKEIYVLLYICVHIRRKSYCINLFFIFSLSVLFLYLVFYGIGETKSQLLSFRQLCLPFVFVLFGYLSDFKKESLVELIFFYVKVCVFTSLFGFVELYLGNDIWKNLGLLQYADLKNNYQFILKSDGVYLSFFTHDLYMITGTRLRRMASFCVDPVILGQLLSIGLIFSIYVKEIFYNKYYRCFSVIIISTALLFTLAKGGIIIALFSSFVLAICNKKRQIFTYFIILVTIMVLGIYAVHSVKYGLSGFKHLKGLISSLYSFGDYPFGRGIGSAGNLATNYGNNSESASGYESYIGSLIVQVGIIGLLLNVILWWKLIPKKKYIRNINVILSSNLALFFTSFVNYTAISFTSCFIYLILGGVALKLNRLYYTEHHLRAL